MKRRALLAAVGLAVATAASSSCRTTAPPQTASHPAEARPCEAGETVCKERARDTLQDSAATFGKSLLDHYQCRFFSVGASILNGACPLDAPPGAAMRPCEMCEVSEDLAPWCHAKGPATLYRTHLSSRSKAIVQAFCDGLGAELARGLPSGAPDLPIQCVPEASGWFDAHKTNTWRDVLGAPGSRQPNPLQIELLRELLWQHRSAAERVLVAQRIQDLMALYDDIGAAERTWKDAHATYGRAGTWPERGGASWQEFRSTLLDQWFEYFSSPGAVRYEVGCAGRYMAFTGAGAAGRWEAGEGPCPTPLCLPFRASSDTGAAARAFFKL